MTVSFAGRVTDTGQFFSRGGRVLPGASTVFWHPYVPLEPPITASSGKGRVQFEFEYSGEGESKTKSIVSTVEYTIERTAQGWRVSWLNVDEL
jgi:hypothetical protein